MKRLRSKSPRRCTTTLPSGSAFTTYLTPLAEPLPSPSGPVKAASIMCAFCDMKSITFAFCTSVAFGPNSASSFPRSSSAAISCSGWCLSDTAAEAVQSPLSPLISTFALSRTRSFIICPNAESTVFPAPMSPENRAAGGSISAVKALGSSSTRCASSTVMPRLSIALTAVPRSAHSGFWGARANISVGTFRSMAVVSALFCAEVVSAATFLSISRGHVHVGHAILKRLAGVNVFAGSAAIRSIAACRRRLRPQVSTAGPNSAHAFRNGSACFAGSPCARIAVFTATLLEWPPSTSPFRNANAEPGPVSVSTETSCTAVCASVSTFASTLRKSSRLAAETFGDANAASIRALNCCATSRCCRRMSTAPSAARTSRIVSGLAAISASATGWSPEMPKSRACRLRNTRSPSPPSASRTALSSWLRT